MFRNSHYPKNKYCVIKERATDSIPSPPTSVEINLCSLQPIGKPSLLLQDIIKTEPGHPGVVQKVYSRYAVELSRSELSSLLSKRCETLLLVK